MNRDIIVIGASAGGVEAIPRLLGSLSARIPAAFFVTLHVAPHSESIMPKLISREGHLLAEHPRDKTPIQPGRVYVAPPDHHLLIGPDIIRLGHGPKENRHRPAIDPMFRSAAKVYGQRVAGVLLTGNLDDGVAGLRDIQQHGGLAIVQDPAEAPYPELPRAALQVLKPDHCLPLHEIEALLATLANGTFGGRMKAKRRARQPFKPKAQPGDEPRGGPVVPVVCPECNGPLWEFHDGKLVRYQCLVGHRYSLNTLVAAHAEELETALWVALRILEERINLQKRLVERSQAAGQLRGRKLFEEKMEENKRHAELLRGLLEKNAKG